MIVVHFTPTFYPVIGGIESVVHTLASHMACLNHQVYVICLSRSNIIDKSTIGSANDGVCVFYYTHLDLVNLSKLSTLIGILRSADALHIHDPKLGLLVAIALAVAPTTRKYLTTHGGFYHHNRLSLIKKIYESSWARFALSRLQTVFAVSDSDYRSFSKMSPISNVFYSANIVNMNPFDVDPLRHPDGVRNWIYWGRVSRNKNLMQLLRLLKYFESNGIRIVLHLCSAYSLSSLIAFSKQLNLKEVFFHHSPEDSHLARLISKSSVFVLPSLSEGFGLTLVEAASSGLLPVFNDISPLNTLFPPEIGLPLYFDDFEASLAAFIHYEEKLSSAKNIFVRDAISASLVYSPVERVREILSMYSA
jgi:alpha-1,3-mannosyltransferase